MIDFGTFASALLFSLGEHVILSLVFSWTSAESLLWSQVMVSSFSSLGVPGHLFLFFLLSKVAAGEAVQLPRSDVSRAT